MSIKKRHTHISSSLEETQTIARKLLADISPHDERATVLFLSGDLGSAKTTTARLLAQELGVRETVISPTFILEKRYAISGHTHFKTLVHIDAYRFDTPSEAKVLRLDDTLRDSHTLVLIEWPEKLGKTLKANLHIHFKSLAENTKEISWQ